MTADDFLARIIEADPLPRVLTEAAIIAGLYAMTNVRVPDLAVTAAPDERGQQALADPVPIIESLSPGNLDDTRDDVRAGATPPGVQDLVVAHSTRVLAEVHRRDAAGVWRPEVSAADGRLRLKSIGLDVALRTAYRRTCLAP